MPSKESLSYSNLLWISIPATLSVAMEPIASAIDTTLIGHKNSLWLGSIAVSNSLISTLVAILNFLLYTVSSRVSQAYGSKNQDQLIKEIRVGVSLALILGITGTLALLSVKPFYLEYFMGLQESHLQNADQYLTIRLLGFTFILLSNTLIGVLRGLQKITLSVYMILISTLINFVITYLTLYVFKTSIWGAALGTSISFFGSTLFGFYHLRKNNFKFTQIINLATIPKLEGFSQDAIYLSIRSFFLIASFFIITMICSRDGPLTISAYQIVYQLFTLSSYFFDGFAITASTVGGKLIGNQKYNEWKILSDRLIHLSIISGFLIALIFYFGSSSLIGIFTSDKNLIETIEIFFPIFVMLMPLNSIVFIMDGIFFGGKLFFELSKILTLTFIFMFVPGIYLIQYFSLPILDASWLAIGLLNLGRFIGTITIYWKIPLEKFQKLKANRI